MRLALAQRVGDCLLNVGGNVEVGVADFQSIHLASRGLLRQHLVPHQHQRTQHDVVE